MASNSKSTALLLLLAAVAIAGAATTAGAAKMGIASEPVPRPSLSAATAGGAAKIGIASEPVPRRPSVASAEDDLAASTCVSALLEVSPCLSFFRDAQATAAPDGCCAGLRTIIDDQAVCLCHIVNHTLERAIGVDIPVDRAFALLGDLCRLAPPEDVLTRCSNKGGVPPLYACPAPSA